MIILIFVRPSQHCNRDAPSSFSTWLTFLELSDIDNSELFSLFFRQEK